MLKKIVSFLLVGLLLVPTLTFAETDYKTLNLKEVLAEEEIESKLGNYEESDEKVNVYLFRGLGCGFCRGFVEYLNDNIDELGKYFNLVSYEVWNDSENSKLLEEVASFTKVEAGGVPYIIVGDRVFDGFTEEAYGEEFKAKLEEEYKNKDRYNVFTEMKKAKKASDSSANTSSSVVVWDAVFSIITIAAVYIMYYNTNKKLSEVLDKSSEKNVKKTKKK